MKERYVSVKKFSLFLALALLSLFLCACEKNGTNIPFTEECEEHTVEIISGYLPTCTENGVSDGEYCAVCGKTITEQTEIEALGHEIVNDVCIRCGMSFAAEGVEFKISADGEYYIVRGIKEGHFGEIVIPSLYEGLPVEEIADEAFSQNTDLIEVHIPETIKKIGKNAFSGCVCIEKVYIEDTGKWCNIEFANEKANPLYYAARLFEKEKEIKRELYIPEGTTVVRAYAFAGLDSVETLKLGYGVEKLEEYSFYGCKSLSTVDFSKTINYIDDKAFLSCSMLRNIDIHDLNDWLKMDHRFPNWYDLYYNDSLLEKLIIPDDVGEIIAYAFEDCRSIRQVILGENVTKINDGAFFGCRKLESIKMNSKLETIGNFAFEDCVALTSVGMGMSVNAIGKAAFRNCRALVSIALPEGVTEISEHLFENCVSMTGASVSLAAEKIGEAAFKDCISLRNIYLPDSITEIGREAFCCCEKLTDAIIPANVRVIEECTFFGSGIRYLDTGGAEEIKMNAFARCKALETVKIGKNLSRMTEAPFEADTEIKSVIITDIDAWCRMELDMETSNPLWSGADLYLDDEIVTALMIPGNIKMINDYTFCGAGSIRNVILYDGVTKVGCSAFENCKNVTEISLPASLTEIFDKAFADCTGLKAITIPKNTESLGTGILYGCEKLQTVSCKAKSKPDGWNDDWNAGNDAKIKWNA